MSVRSTEAWRLLGSRLAQLRRAAGYNQQSFAPLTGYSRSTIANIETGRQQASRAFWQRCDQVLAASGALMELYEQQVSRSRAAFNQALEATLPAPTLNEAQEGATLTIAGPIDPDMVPHWLNMLRILAASHDAFGPRRLHDVVRGELNIIQKHRAAASGQTLRELLRVESRWAEFASWTADNLGDSHDAGYWLRQALSMAREARDGTMMAYVLMRQAQRAAERRDTASALAFADAINSRSDMTPRDRALCAVRNAHANALAGHREQCQLALRQAHKLVADAEEPDDPDTIGRHCVPSYVIAHEGHCHLLLGQPRQAVVVLEEVLRTWPAAYRQDEGLARTWLATAFAQLGRAEEAVEQGEIALNLAVEAGSKRLTNALHHVAQGLAPHRSLPQADQFRARYTLVQQVAGTIGR